MLNICHSMSWNLCPCFQTGSCVSRAATCHEWRCCIWLMGTVSSQAKEQRCRQSCLMGIVCVFMFRCEFVYVCSCMCVHVWVAPRRAQCSLWHSSAIGCYHEKTKISTQHSNICHICHMLFPFCESITIMLSLTLYSSLMCQICSRFIGGKNKCILTIFQSCF